MVETRSEAVDIHEITNEKSNVNGHIIDVRPPTTEDHPLGENPQLEPVVSEGEDEAADNQDENTNPVNLGVARPKKRSKRKSKSKRGLTAPTGFEEFYVDTPVTPAEHEAELGLYHQSIPFSERIQTAIQKYFQRRNLNSERKDIFDKYMAYGGIEAGPKMFSGGLDAKTLADKTAVEIKDMNATHFAAPGRGGPEDKDFVVDFEACTKAFLSSRLPLLYDLRTEQRIKDHTAIIRNFLNYLLHHDVCPEYRDDVNRARAVCDQAAQQLWDIARANALMPGQFNRACSEIFGGFYSGSYVGDREWAKGLDIPPGMSPDEARSTFKVGLIAHATEDVFSQYKSQSASGSISITSSVDTNLEVTELILANRNILKIYDQKVAKGLKVLGTMRARTWCGPYPADDEEDLTAEEEAAAAAAPPDTREYEFWIEDELVQRCFVGMKLQTIVHHLSFGVDFFDNIAGAYCSFYTVLPNEAMMGWREPGPKLPMREKVGDGGRGGMGDGGGEGGGEDEEDEE